MRAHQVFLLSPARVDGARGKLLLEPRTTFELARRLSEPAGASLGDVFAFLSGVYFRGKLAYASAFGHAPGNAGGVHVITTNRGLLNPAERVRRADLASFAEVDIARAGDAFLAPFIRDARALDVAIGPSAHIILLGSIATAKYVEPLLGVFGERLLFPESFVGRGDMSRGGLLLRSVRAGEELTYTPVASAVRHGPRPPKLVRLK